jgi:two-component system phosphate regulon sensor histidine kinase PhoR
MSREQDAILRSMNEGVVTVDSTGRIARVNEAARSLLGIHKAYVESMSLEEVVPQEEIRAFIKEAASSMLPTSGSVLLTGERTRVFDVYGSPLFQDDGSSSGTLIVVRDMTRVHNLEVVRRDFVANVSHELKTPVTSIKGFAETLLDGAIEDPEACNKFVGIIAKHAERLHAILNDLLTLARLEAGGDEARMELMPYKLGSLVREAIDVCEGAAAVGQVAVSSSVPDDIVVVVNPSLMQQAVVNLVDNAIKYSESGASVRVAVERQGEFVRCMVIDNGPGIDSSHLPRLFERFYRVDQGRSRQMGGTGLGLSIVKHIVLAHGGRVAVESALGQGSVFSIYLKAQ